MAQRLEIAGIALLCQALRYDGSVSVYYLEYKFSGLSSRKLESCKILQYVTLPLNLWVSSATEILLKVATGIFSLVLPKGLVTTQNCYTVLASSLHSSSGIRREISEHVHL